MSHFQFFFNFNRSEVRNKYLQNSKAKVDTDYRYTKEDYTKLELDRISEVRLSAQETLKQAYFAYLTNTPGSKKAIHECMKEFEKENPNKRKTGQKPQSNDNERRQSKTNPSTTAANDNKTKNNKKITQPETKETVEEEPVDETKTKTNEPSEGNDSETQLLNENQSDPQ